MDFHIFTLFPQMFEGPLSESIIKRARERGLIGVHLHNIRDFAIDKHRIVDDSPYGGGPGMVMKPEPIFGAVEDLLTRLNKTDKPGKSTSEVEPPPIILMSPRGRVFNHRVALDLSRHPCIIIICGHYEGVDERVKEHLITDEISLGDYVLTGGELAAMVVVDAVARLLPGVLGSEESIHGESHSDGLLQFPQYTRPPDFRGWEVPEVLLSGHHGEIQRWRRRQSLLLTRKTRPDLLDPADLSDDEKRSID
ncbi:MAG: tRNA (guanosine(37)-N1)-methyltransferase TrmD [Chloroflexi bacterium]|nr:tRNA (guanosine(37)-N1)-methyltransferase TrmD [Chloroflexota bacterium]